jgi:Flp pilus assembly protein TadG
MRRLPSYARDEGGAVLVEFALVLPMLLILFATTIESARMFWAYQATIAGVRDATRFVARAADADLCETGGDLSGWQETVFDIVANSADGSTLFPDSMSVTAVTPALVCTTADLRQARTPVATVTADLQVTFPFSSLFTLAGVTLPTVATQVSDSGRIFGS